MIPPTPWSQLLEVRSFSIQVVTYPDGSPLVSQEGSGRICVESREATASSVIIWRERGRWTTGPLAGISFRNSTAWRKVTGIAGLEISHLRRGDHLPTLLGRLHPHASGQLISETPHQCGLDSYRATLSWSLSRIELRWDVESPSDPYQLRFVARRDDQPDGSGRFAPRDP